ncbi:MAG: DinB family protein [Chloroflexota bacterium]
MSKSSQLQQFDAAYESFVALLGSLSPEQFLRHDGGWAPRDIVAHLIGWNRNIRTGCEQILSGSAPFYHADGPNDYRTINAEFVAHYSSTDREALLRELAESRRSLKAFLEGVDEQDWSLDSGPQHYRGGPATVGRCVESITADYLEHAKEIMAGM